MVAGPPDALEAFFGALERREPGFRSGLEAMAADSVALGATAVPLLSGGNLVRLTSESLALLAKNGMVRSGDGAIASWVTSANGRFAGNLTFERVTMGPAQLASLQLTLAMLAIRMAIRNVAQAVERVEAAVDDVRLLVESERLGDVIGAHEALWEPAIRLRKNGCSSMTDWSIVGHLHAELLGQVVGLRSYVEGRMKEAATAGGLRKRSTSAGSLDDRGGVRIALALLVVAEGSLGLWQELRLAHVATWEPEDVEIVMASAREELESHLRADTRLTEQFGHTIRSLTDARPFEGLLPWTHEGLDEARRNLGELRSWFMDQRGFGRKTIEDVERAGVIDEAKAIGSILANTSRATTRAAANALQRRRDRVLVPVRERRKARGELPLAPEKPEE